MAEIPLPFMSPEDELRTALIRFFSQCVPRGDVTDGEFAVETNRAIEALLEYVYYTTTRTILHHLVICHGYDETPDSGECTYGDTE